LPKAFTPLSLETQASCAGSATHSNAKPTKLAEALVSLAEHWRRWPASTSNSLWMRVGLLAIIEFRDFRSPKFAVTERGAPAWQSYRSPPFEAEPKRCWAA